MFFLSNSSSISCWLLSLCNFCVILCHNLLAPHTHTMWRPNKKVATVAPSVTIHSHNCSVIFVIQLLACLNKEAQIIFLHATHQMQLVANKFAKPTILYFGHKLGVHNVLFIKSAPFVSPLLYGGVLQLSLFDANPGTLLFFGVTLLRSHTIGLTMSFIQKLNCYAQEVDRSATEKLGLSVNFPVQSRYLTLRYNLCSSDSVKSGG